MGIFVHIFAKMTRHKWHRQAVFVCQKRQRKKLYTTLISTAYVTGVAYEHLTFLASTIRVVSVTF